MERGAESENLRIGPEHGPVEAQEHGCGPMRGCLSVVRTVVIYHSTVRNLGRR